MTSLVNKSGDWTLNYHKILIFSPPKSLKSLRAARIDELADSNEPAKIGTRSIYLFITILFWVLRHFIYKPSLKAADDNTKVLKIKLSCDLERYLSG